MIDLYIEKTQLKVTSEMFIKKIADKYLGICPKDLRIEKNQHGKPFLVDFPNTHYNVSHTKGIIVCAISDNHIGIDVEKIKNFNSRIPSRFFTKNEQNYISCRKDDKNKRFFEIWTRKEAYIKWLGKGLEIPLNSFDVIYEDRIITMYVDEYIISICTELLREEMKANNKLLINLMRLGEQE